MPRIYLDTVSDDTITNWSVYGGASDAYLAVRRDSGDSTGITTTTAGALAKLVVDTGHYPAINFIQQLTLRCRCRKTDPLAAGGSLAIRIYNDLNGLPFAFATRTLTAAWSWIEVTAHVNLAGTRLGLTDIYKLKAHIAVGALPSSGSIEVSEVYIQEDVVEGFICWYDAVCGLVPDAVVGALQWSTSGGQAASIASPYLRINDASIVDNRSYAYIVQNLLLPEHSTRIDTVFYISSTPATAGSFYTVLSYQDASSSVELVLFRKVDGTIHLCLTEASRDHENFTDCLATYELTDFTTSRIYQVTATIDRGVDPHNLGKINVALDYGSTPILSIYYADLASIAYAPQVGFGTRTIHTCSARVEYFACASFRSQGAAFRAWEQLESAGSRVLVDPGDSQICHLRPLSVLPEVVVGQSNNACKFSCLGGPPCGVRQITALLNDSVAHTLEVEYRDSTTAVAPLRVTIQRSSDLFYWDEGTTSWIAAVTYADLLHSALRTKAVVTTTLVLPSPQALVLTLEYNFTGLPMAPPHIWLYRIYLAET